MEQNKQQGPVRRLLVVTQHFWPESFRINDIVQGFLQDGIQVDVLCGMPNYPKGEWFAGYDGRGPRQEEFHGAQMFRCREIPRRGNTGLRIFLNYCSWPLYARLALGRLPGSYDAILCYNTSPVLMNWPALAAAKRFGAPMTCYVLDLWPENLYSVLPIRSRMLRAVAQGVSDWLYRRCDRLIAMSPSLAQRLAQRTGKPLERIGVIPQYCEDFYAQPARDEQLCAQFAGQLNLVFAGNFSPAQSLDTVIRAVAQANRSLAQSDAALPPVHLLLVGDGMSRPQLEALTEELNARPWVTFYGSVPPERIPAINGFADGLVVSLSNSPDLGLTVPAKVSSCMAAGKPLLASLDGEGFLAVQESGGGLVSHACDQDALAQNILSLCRMSPAQRAALGQRAKAYYQAHYSRSELLRALEKFIL